MNDPQKHALLHFCRHITYLMELMLKDADTIQGSLESLQASLPQEEDSPGGSQQQHQMRVKRHPLLLFSMALSGVFGTLMGWFTHHQLNLQDQIGEVRNQ